MENGIFKNWKSFLAFFLFLIIYGYTAFTVEDAETIWNTGLIALISFIAIMSRSDLGAQLMTALVDIIKLKMK